MAPTWRAPWRSALGTTAVVVLVVPLAVAAVLVVWPALDGRWQEPVVHFWIVGLTAVAGTVVALLAAEAAHRRRDARLYLLALSFGASALFLGVHAYVTPGVIADAANNGFETAVPIGLLVSASLAAASTVELRGSTNDSLLRARWLGWLLLAALAVAMVVATLEGTGLLADPPGAAAADRVVVVAGIVGTALFAYAAWRYLGLDRRRPGARVLAGTIVCLVLLTDALLVVQVGRNWQLSWWEWHLLLAGAFVVLAATTRLEWWHEGGRSGLFDSLAVEATLERVRADYAAALEDLVAGIDAAADGDDQDVGPLVDAVALRFDLTDQQARLLREAAAALGENRRLYRELDALFRSYLSPEVAAALIDQPDRASLGGTVEEVSVLHADLAGFTAFSEVHEPTEVLAMLNCYFAAAVPAVLDQGGTITFFAGDALMAVFGAPVAHRDHARRAVAAAVALQRAVDLARDGDDWPRFRTGVSTGPAVVGNVGSDSLRSFTAIGDTVNVAARLESAAPLGGVLISDATRTAAGGVETEPVGDLPVKGRSGAVAAHRVLRLRG